MNDGISWDEVEEGVRRQNNGKAAGPDVIPYEMYKNGCKVLIDRMTDLFNCLYLPSCNIQEKSYARAVPSPYLYVSSFALNS